MRNLRLLVYRLGKNRSKELVWGYQIKIPYSTFMEFGMTYGAYNRRFLTQLSTGLE